eukprot:13151861-Alexandrium_andersonii.AAC.1
METVATVDTRVFSWWALSGVDGTYVGDVGAFVDTMVAVAVITMRMLVLVVVLGTRRNFGVNFEAFLGSR